MIKLTRELLLDGQAVSTTTERVELLDAFDRLLHATHYGLDLRATAEIGSALTIEAVTDTEIRWVFHEGPNSCTILTIADEEREIRNERFICIGSAEEIAPLRELIEWAYYGNRLPHPVTGARIKQPSASPGSLLPALLICNQSSSQIHPLHLFILSQYDVSLDDLKALERKPRWGINVKIMEAGNMWREEFHKTMTFGAALRDLLELSTQPTAKAG